MIVYPFGAIWSITLNQVHMPEKFDLISIYSGTEANVLLLKGRFDMVGIASHISRDSKAGSWGTIPDNIDLLVDRSHREEAEKIIHDFVHGRKVSKF